MPHYARRDSVRGRECQSRGVLLLEVAMSSPLSSEHSTLTGSREQLTSDDPSYNADRAVVREL